MKRILALLLVLTLLLSVVPAYAEVDYAADYEAALTLAHNDLTNIKSLETAVDMLQQLGGYGFAKTTCAICGPRWMCRRAIPICR